MAERAAETPKQERQVGRRVTDFTCTGCGCLCDDLTITVADAGRFELGGLSCSLATRFLGAEVERLARAQAAPAALMAGQPATLEKSLSAVEGLLAIPRPMARWIVGPAESSMEAQRSAVKLADLVSASIDTGPTPSGMSRWLARQRAGWVSATWGEIRQRADFVLFWDLDPGPGGSHPRFTERFLDPPGRFVPGGRSDRSLLRLTTWSDRPDGSESGASITLGPTGVLAMLSGLRALVRGRVVDAVRLEAATGRSLAFWVGLVRRMAAARYGVLVTGLDFDRNASVAECEALERLIADVNAFGTGRFVGCALGPGGNRTGLEAVLGWQAGAPGPVDFGRGFPRYLPCEAEPTSRLEPGQEVVVLAIGPRPAAVAAAIGTSPDLVWIQIGYDATLREPGARVPDVALATAHPWLEAGGTVMRGDGVCLPLTPIFPSRRPSDFALLERLCRAVGYRGAEP